MLRSAKARLTAISSKRTDAIPACTDCAPRLVMPMMDDGRFADTGLSAARWAAFEFVTWWYTDDNPLAENVCPIPANVLPSIDTMVSPGRRPASAAGVWATPGQCSTEVIV